ncbi:hypothetical protein SAMN05421877_1109 [Sphingobacterium lactis]|uniref:Uncharacterized protein n=1 Tax=Sphingobacterium lactis TaxID=797291 RepID=A0A1H6BCE3_9SPHI|nr:hypothetical protein SAMN05421877_1109 [Sphingobacterium lactis]
MKLFYSYYSFAFLYNYNEVFSGFVYGDGYLNIF